MNATETLRPALDRTQRIFLAVGLAAAAISAAALGLHPDPARFLRSYLLAFVFWTGVSLGSLALLMLHHMVGGGWGLIIRRFLEASTRTLPLMALLALPLLAGVPRIYEWAHADVVAADEILKHKSAYLNVPFFIIRTILYFAIWILLAALLNRWSSEQDRTGGPGILVKMKKLSAPGILLYGLTATFAAVDWVMSLEPHWFSTAYGVLFIAGQVLSTLAFVNTLVMLMGNSEPLARVITKARLQDLGNLMMAFTLLWAYISFSQFLIIWSGNLPEEITWYLRRFHGGWMYVAVFLLVFHFALPFMILLSRDIKRKAKTLGRVAIAIFFIRFVDLYWVVAPSGQESGAGFHWLDAVLPLGLGGIWLAYFIRQLRDRPLLPSNDPLLQGALKHE